jgi:hypothetical protein
LEFFKKLEKFLGLLTFFNFIPVIVTVTGTAVVVTVTRTAAVLTITGIAAVVFPF